MKLIKGKNVKIIPTEKDKMKELFGENAGYITEFFNETVGRYKEGEILNFMIITEDHDDDMEIFGLTHSTAKHLRGLLGDVITTIRRKEWGEEEDEE